MIWLLSMLLSLQDPTTPTEPAPDRPTFASRPDHTGITRCAQASGMRDVDTRIVLQCRLDAAGVPHGCTLRTPETLPDNQLAAARCMANHYRFAFPDGRSPEGALVRVPMHLMWP